jgi:hypothetical protein
MCVDRQADSRQTADRSNRQTDSRQRSMSLGAHRCCHAVCQSCCQSCCALIGLGLLGCLQASSYQSQQITFQVLGAARLPPAIPRSQRCSGAVSSRRTAASQQQAHAHAAPAAASTGSHATTPTHTREQLLPVRRRTARSEAAMDSSTARHDRLWERCRRLGSEQEILQQFTATEMKCMLSSAKNRSKGDMAAILAKRVPGCARVAPADAAAAAAAAKAPERQTRKPRNSQPPGRCDDEAEDPAPADDDTPWPSPTMETLAQGWYTPKSVPATGGGCAVAGSSKARTGAVGDVVW